MILSRNYFESHSYLQRHTSYVEHKEYITYKSVGPSDHPCGHLPPLHYHGSIFASASATNANCSCSMLTAPVLEYEEATCIYIHTQIRVHIHATMCVDYAKHLPCQRFTERQEHVVTLSS